MTARTRPAAPDASRDPADGAAQLVYYDATGGGVSWRGFGLTRQLLATTPVAPIVRGQVYLRFMADNAGGCSTNRRFPDWIELWNSTNATVNLTGYYLTDDPLVPNKWALPAWTLGANQYLTVFASEKNLLPPQAVAGQDNPGTPAQPHLHTTFKLSKEGGYLALMQSNGSGGYNAITVFADYPAQRENVSYGTSDAEGYLGYMEVATPGATNDTTVAGFVADTVFTDGAVGSRGAPLQPPFTLATTATPARPSAIPPTRTPTVSP